MNPKEKKRKQELSKLKQEIRQEAWDREEYYCQGCGISGVKLDCSHILSVARRKDLELDKSNINLFCRDCHNHWESNNEERQKKLLTYDKDMAYIKSKEKIYKPPFDHEANKTVKKSK
jgi:5-methylcytosine-specific restriction endonuclease McrA